MVHCSFQNERSFVPDCHKKKLFWIPCRHLGFQNWYQILQFSILKQYVKSYIISYKFYVGSMGAISYPTMQEGMCIVQASLGNVHKWYPTFFEFFWPPIPPKSDFVQLHFMPLFYDVRFWPSDSPHTHTNTNKLTYQFSKICHFFPHFFAK